MMDRRRVVLAGAAGIAAALAACPATRLLAGGTLKPEPEFDYLVALEGHSGGRLGAAFLDGKSGKIVGHRIDERFTMCSTFKFSLAAAVLARIDAGTLDGAALVPVAKSDLVGHSPAVEAALGKGSLSILALAEAAQTVSDNAAANLLLARIGGPAGMTRFWRDLGDD
ncbi:MAG: serine hydrolase, partial [Sphingobium sp.]